MARLKVVPRFEHEDADALGARLWPVRCNIPGFQITQLQIALYNRGYLRERDDVNGIYDRNTESAHRAYERDNIDAGWKEMIMPHLTPEQKGVYDAV